MVEKLDESLSDEQIIHLLRSGGSSRYFELLYHRYFLKVLNKCKVLVKDNEQAEILAGDILSKTFEKLSLFRQDASFSTWLYSITYNHCIDYLRLKKKLHYPSWDQKRDMDDIPDIEEVSSNINYEKLEPLFELIHPEEKALLFMKYIDNLSIRQISKALRITENATKMRLKRARTRLLFLYREKYLKS